MSLLNDIPLSAIVGVDSAPLIYYIEAHPKYGPLVRPFFEDRISQGLNIAVTSTVSLAEVLMQPLMTGRNDLVQRYRDLLTAGPHLIMHDVTAAVAERAAGLRGKYNLRLPDVLQIATALEKNAAFFLTNDLRLRRVTDLQVLVLDDYLPPSP
jgi:predicted nucleic acid-binding protein